MIGFIVAAGVAGLTGSLHCVGMCGPFAVSCGQRAKDALPWHAGRLVTYSILGASAGALGSTIPGPGWVGAVVSTLLVIWFAAALGGIVPQPAVVIPGLTRLASSLVTKPGTLPRFAFGLANGLLPCGLVYAALSIPVAAANPWTGAFAMMAFGLGTVPALTAVILGAQRIGLKNLWIRRAMAATVLVAGLWSVAARQGLTTSTNHRHTDEQPVEPGG